ncbi:MAG: hypothetical protein ACREXP_09045, partial [Steroidobacteraceae bacterium]
MRILDARYSRDLRRHNLALRMIRHEARTLTIRMWTGLSATRIRKLYRSYVATRGIAAPTQRHRGPQPSRLQPLWRSKHLAPEAAVVAGLSVAMGVLPTKPMPNADRELPSVGNGERLCYAFELYQQMVSNPQIRFDLLIPLIIALARRVELALGHCDRCDAAMLIALLENRPHVCTQCELEAGAAPNQNGVVTTPSSRAEGESEDVAESPPS